MKKVLFLIALYPALLAAKEQPVYQDAVLVSFKDVQEGMFCSHNGNTTGTVSDNGNVSATTNGTSNCAPRIMRHYTIHVGDETYVIEHTMTGGQKGAAVATLGWSAILGGHSVLFNQLPGTHFLVRSDDKGLWVKLGKKESKFTIIEAPGKPQ